MLEYGFYNSINGDRRYNSVQMSEIFEGLITDGVYPSVGEKFAVTAGEGMQIIVGTGRAWFDSTWSRNKARYPMSIDIADPVFERIDTVCIKVDKSDAVRANSFTVVKGIVSTTPAPSQLPVGTDVFYHPIAYVHVKPAATSFTASNIEILVGKSVCPFTTSILQQTNIDALFANWNDQFMTWWAELKTILDGDAVGNIMLALDGKVNVDDKSTTALAQAGSDNTTWMTPATTKSAITKQLTSYRPLATGDIIFSVDSLGTEYKNLGEIQQVTGLAASSYIGPKPRVFKDSVFSSIPVENNYYMQYLYQGIWLWKSGNYFRKSMYNAKYFDTCKEETITAFSYPIGFVPTAANAGIAFYLGASSGTLKSCRLSLGTMETAASVIANTTWTILTTTISNTAKILNYYSYGNSQYVVMLYGTTIYTFVYNSSSPTSAPSVYTASMGSWALIEWATGSNATDDYSPLSSSSVVCKFLVYNSSTRYIGIASVSATGAISFTNVSSLPLAYSAPVILDINSYYCVLTYSESTSAKYVGVAVVNLNTGSASFKRLITNYGSYTPSVAAMYYGGYVYVSLHLSYDITSSLTFTSDISPYAKVGDSRFSFLKNNTTFFKLQFTGTALNPAVYTEEALIGVRSSIKSRMYRSGNFVVWCYSYSGDVGYTCLANLKDGWIKRYENIYGSISSYGLVYGANCLVDKYYNDIFFSVVHGDSSNTYNPGQICKFDRTYLDIRDNELSQYMWMK